MDSMSQSEFLQRAHEVLDIKVKNLQNTSWGWQELARPVQVPPSWDWRYFHLIAGRRFGKTRAGVEWAIARAVENPGSRVAVVTKSVSGTLGEAASALERHLNVYESIDSWTYQVPLTLVLSNGSKIYVLGFDTQQLRGHQFDSIFVELDQLRVKSQEELTELFGVLDISLRLGERPQMFITSHAEHGETVPPYVSKSGEYVLRDLT